MSNASPQMHHEEYTGLKLVPVQDRANEKIETIAKAARVVIRRSGRDNFRTSEVADEAGCSIGTIYRYFPNRVAILDYVWPDRRDTIFPEDDEASLPGVPQT